MHDKDVSSRIVVSLFDFLSHKEIDINHLYELMEDPDSLAVVPDSMRALPGFVPWNQFGNLLTAFARVVNNNDWAREFVAWALHLPAPWTRHLRLAAPHMDHPGRMHRFLVHWFPKFEMPAVQATADEADGHLTVQLQLTRHAGRQQTFELLAELFRQAPALLGSPQPAVRMEINQDRCRLDTTFPEGSGRFRQAGSRFIDMLAGRAQTDTVHDFYAALWSEYEVINQERTAAAMATGGADGHSANDRAHLTFLDKITHELRTPLTSILGFVELLQTRVVSPNKTEAYLETIRANSQMLLERINHLLDLARAGSEQHARSPEPTGLQRPSSSLPDAAGAPEQLLANARILLMDDVYDIQMLYSTILRMAGALVDVADNGRHGLSLADTQSYDLIVVDLKMPVMDGFEATRHLRNGGYKRPIIALTSYARPQERQESLDAGCSDHISKPVSASQLVEKISCWLVQANAELPPGP
jgi:CheY-like chemotaxis protein